MHDNVLVVRVLHPDDEHALAPDDDEHLADVLAQVDVADHLLQLELKLGAVQVLRMYACVYIRTAYIRVYVYTDVYTYCEYRVYIRIYTGISGEARYICVYSQYV